MNRLKKAVIGGGIAAGIVAMSLGFASPASAAYPESCTHWAGGVNDHSAYAVCDGGGGAYRSIGVCQSPWGNYYLYGPWVTPGNVSQTGHCPFGMLYSGLNSRGT